MADDKVKSDWRVEYDHEFARWYRQQNYKPFIALFFSGASFVTSAVIGKPGVTDILGFLLLAFALLSYYWRDYKLKETYECKLCAKRLRFSEPDHENEIRYFCFDCCIEYRVRTDGRYDIDLPTNSPR